MAGVLEELRDAIGQALFEWHREAGFKVRYTLVTDRATMATSVLDIFVWPTSDVEVRTRIAGRYQDVLSPGGNVPADQLPIYVVTREALKVAGVPFDPTTEDFFFKLDENDNPIGNKFDVAVVTALGGRPAAWFLSVTTQFHQSASG